MSSLVSVQVRIRDRRCTKRPFADWLGSARLSPLCILAGHSGLFCRKTASQRRPSSRVGMLIGCPASLHFQCVTRRSTCPSRSMLRLMRRCPRAGMNRSSLRKATQMRGQYNTRMPLPPPGAHCARQDDAGNATAASSWVTKVERSRKCNDDPHLHHVDRSTMASLAIRRRNSSSVPGLDILLQANALSGRTSEAAVCHTCPAYTHVYQGSANAIYLQLNQPLDVCVPSPAKFILPW